MVDVGLFITVASTTATLKDYTHKWKNNHLLPNERWDNWDGFLHIQCVKVI